MKKITIAVMIVLFVGTALAQTTVLSGNAVGYVKLDFTAGQFKLVGCPFNNLSTDDPVVVGKVSEVLGTEGIPNGTKVWLYVGGVYAKSQFYTSGNAWYPDPVIERGEGFWVDPVADFSVYVVGEVPSETRGKATTMAFTAGFQIFSHPFPVAKSINDMDLKSVANNGDKIWAYDGTTYSKTQYYSSGSAWYPELTLEPGVAYWYDAVSDTTVFDEVKTYPWP